VNKIRGQNKKIQVPHMSKRKQKKKEENKKNKKKNID
jgi:hypothetical protein